MSRIVIALTATNMGPANLAEDFDAWHNFVCNNIDDALGFNVCDVTQANAGSEDRIEGATEEQREAIRRWLAVDGWETFCSDRDESESDASVQLGTTDGFAY